MLINNGYAKVKFYNQTRKTSFYDVATACFYNAHENKNSRPRPKISKSKKCFTICFSNTVFIIKKENSPLLSVRRRREKESMFLQGLVYDVVINTLVHSSGSDRFCYQTHFLSKFSSQKIRSFGCECSTFGLLVDRVMQYSQWYYLTVCLQIQLLSTLFVVYPVIVRNW